jgi:hypothetical protein
VRGRLTSGCDDVTAAVIDGGLGEGFGSVLHDKEYIKSMPLHENGEKLMWSGGSPKRVGAHRHGNVERRRRWTNGGANRSPSCAWSGGSTGACT